MKTPLLLAVMLWASASAEVVTKSSVETSAVTGVKLATVGMFFPGGGDQAMLVVTCQQSSRGEHFKQEVILGLQTGTVPQSSPGFRDSSYSAVATLLRLDEEARPKLFVWTRTETAGLLIRRDSKFVRDHLLKSKMVHIEITGYGAATKSVSFDLTGLREEYDKHQECKQK